jgi:hypothetical protein
MLYRNSISAHGANDSIGGISSNTLFSYSTVLSIGYYRLVAKANAGLRPTSSLFNSADSNFDIHADFTIPVPAAAWLFGSGLLGLIGVSAKRRHY